MPLASRAIRAHNLAAVLAALHERRPVSRTGLAAATGLSKPTVASAIRAFEESGLVRRAGLTSGHRGPSAALYDLVPTAALVLAVDIGPAIVRWRLVDVDGRICAEDAVDLPSAHLEQVVRALDAVALSVAEHSGEVEIAVVGSPGIVDPRTGRIGAAPTIHGWEGIHAAALAERSLNVDCLVENDVNLAAFGEQAHGAGRSVDSFALLSVDSGVGAGIVLHGRLHRGARGAAGEIGFLPVGAEPFGAARGGHAGAMEARLSREALVAEAERLTASHTTSCPLPFDVGGLFAAARQGDPLGRAILEHTVRELAVCVAGLTAVADLELVLLGGSVGACRDLDPADVAAAVATLVPSPPRIERAALDDAVLAGAVAVGLETGRERSIARLVANA